MLPLISIVLIVIFKQMQHFARNGIIVRRGLQNNLNYENKYGVLYTDVLLD